MDGRAGSDEGRIRITHQSRDDDHVIEGEPSQPAVPEINYKTSMKAPSRAATDVVGPATGGPTTTGADGWFYDPVMTYDTERYSTGDLSSISSKSRLESSTTS